jgi:hypothetical protein
MSYICWIFERGYCASWAPQWEESAEIQARCSPNELERVESFGDSFWWVCAVACEVLLSLRITLARCSCAAIALSLRLHVLVSLPLTL